MPSWTPDGNSIFFAGDHSDYFGGIEVVPAGGGEVRRIPIDLAEGEGFLQSHYPSGGISVSPDGGSILFAGHFVKTRGENGLFILPIEGGEPLRLTGSEPLDAEPAFSSDGRHIAFVKYQKEADTAVFNISIMPAEGGKPFPTTTTDDMVQMASIRWSPDGGLIAFLGRDETPRVIPVGGGPSRVLVEKLGDAVRWQGISWSPDGKTLAYALGNGLWKVPRDGGTPTKDATGLKNARLGKIAWSPDGTAIAFCAYQGGERELRLMEDFVRPIDTTASGN